MSKIVVRSSPILEVLIFKFDGYSPRRRSTDTCERSEGQTDIETGTNGYDEPNGRLLGFMQTGLKPASTVNKT